MGIEGAIDASFKSTRFRKLELGRENDIRAGGIAEPVSEREGCLRIEPAILSALAKEAFHDINYYFRGSQLEAWANIMRGGVSPGVSSPGVSSPGVSSPGVSSPGVSSPGVSSPGVSSPNDRYVAASLLRNAAISAEGILPSCQDTGTATVIAWKGENLRTGGNDAAALEEGIARCYTEYPLRASQLKPLSMFEEKNTGNNLPAFIDIHAASEESGEGKNEYRFLFIAKGGGSANKTKLFQENKSLLNVASFEAFLKREIQALGTAACPPYHLVVIVGGRSPEYNLSLQKLASAGILDSLPIDPSKGEPYRDLAWESRVMELARETGLGAQFGGDSFAIDARVIRAARHSASCAVSIGVSCSAHRNALAKIGPDGVWLEEFDREPSRFLEQSLPILKDSEAGAKRISLERPMGEIRAELSKLPVGGLALLSGPVIVARDSTHARFADIVRQTGKLPEYLSEHPVFYAGPAKTPPGSIIGSLGPTTSARMDPYVPEFMAKGASLVMIAKGNRSYLVTEACQRYGGFYLAAIGGAAALATKEHIVADELLDFPELGMEAARKVWLRDLPVFVVIDDKGNCLYP